MIFHGPGVIGASLATATLSIVLSLAHILLTQWNNAEMNTSKSSLVRSLFRRFFASPLICQRVLDPTETRQRWLKILERVSLSLSDQQLIWWLAVLVAGLSLHCSISVYHFSIVKDLGWLSAIVHLSTILTLECFFESNRLLRKVRVWLICINAALLIYSLIITAHPRQRSNLAYNAQCLLDDLPYGLLEGIDIISITYIILCHVFLIKGLFSTTEISAEHRTMISISNILIKILSDSLKFFSRHYSARIAGWVFCNLMLVSRVGFLFYDLNKSALEIRRMETAMGFGQIVPVSLLCSTGLVFMEALSVKNPLLFNKGQLQLTFDEGKSEKTAELCSRAIGKPI